jgi:hypothetical protein
MDKSTFEIVDPLMDEIAESTEEVLDSPTLAQLSKLLVDLNTKIGSRYAVSLSVTVDVFDREKERCLPLLQTGLSGFDGDKPYHTTGDSTPQKYVADGEIQIVPHDRCPKCWGAWDFKFKNRSCRECGATLGKNVKVLLDTDICPQCERGKVSMTHPRCSDCGHEVDLNLVTWG